MAHTPMWALYQMCLDLSVLRCFGAVYNACRCYVRASQENQWPLQEYVSLLIEEVNASALVGEQPLRTVYFGGGTPSLIPPLQLERLIKYALHPSCQLCINCVELGGLGHSVEPLRETFRGTLLWL